MTEEIQAWTDGDLAYKLVLLKKLADLVIEESKRTKAIATLQYPKGASIPARSGEDIKLGRVTKTDPKPVAEVVDSDALDEWIRTTYPDKLDHDVILADRGELVAFLKDQGRTDLYTETAVIPGYLYKQVETLAIQGRPIPGLIVNRPDGVLQVRAELAAEYLVRRLLSGARVPLLGIEA